MHLPFRRYRDFSLRLDDAMRFVLHQLSICFNICRNFVRGNSAAERKGLPLQCSLAAATLTCPRRFCGMGSSL